MRIIGGKYRGKKLWSPVGEGVRPTADRAREAIFNILYSHTGGDYSQLTLLDVFAGTGAFGLEAMSRGFKKVTFIDIDTTSVQKNVKMFANDSEKLHILKADAGCLQKARQKYDVVFMDAPYNCGLTQKALQQLIKQNWLNSGALCIVEIRHNEELEIPEFFELIDERIYGMAKVLFLIVK